jgi:3-phosphoshikimate 1-carboxyvinyltransferase
VIIAPPHKPICTGVDLPGSKSISNRLLVIRHVLGVDFQINNLSDGDDTRSLREALSAITAQSASTIAAGEGGTTFRFLCALLAATPGEWMLTAGGKMLERPVVGLVSALRRLGAEISYTEREGHPPLRIRGKKLTGGKLSIDASVSSQFISALLLVTPLLTTPLEIVLCSKPVSAPYIQMTIDLLREFKVNAEWKNNSIVALATHERAIPREMTVEGDWSSASYWYSICALSEGSAITLRPLLQKSLQGDRVVAAIFEQLGVRSEFRGNDVRITRQNSVVGELSYDFTGCPDLAQTVACTCAALSVKGRFTGLSTLKDKESDRLGALRSELGKFNVKVETGDDWLFLEPSPLITPGQPLSAHGDHRMAMSLAPLSLRSGRISLTGHEVVSKSYPAFWDHLRAAAFQLSLHAS